MPFLIVCFFIAYLDRANVSCAALTIVVLALGGQRRGGMTRLEMT